MNKCIGKCDYKETGNIKRIPSLKEELKCKSCNNIIWVNKKKKKKDE